MAVVEDFFRVRERRQRLQQELARWGDKYQELGQMLQRWPALVHFRRGGQGVRVSGDIPPGKVRAFDMEDFQRVEEIARLVEDYQKAHLEELRMYRTLPEPARSSISPPPPLW